MFGIVNNTGLSTRVQQFNSQPAPQLRLKTLQQDVFTKSTPVAFMANKQKPNEKTIDYYEKNASGYFESTKGVTSMKALCDRFMSYLPEGSTIVDAGCGSGRDSKYFLDNGYKVISFDASAKLAKLASKYIEQPVLTDTFESFKSKKPVDGIWACASLLHLEKAELDKSVANLADNLKPGGYFFACLKDGQGEAEDKKGRFFSYYSQDELRQVFAKNKNLEVVDSWKTGDNMNRNDTVWNCIIVKKV